MKTFILTCEDSEGDTVHIMTDKILYMTAKGLYTRIVLGSGVGIVVKANARNIIDRLTKGE